MTNSDNKVKPELLPCPFCGSPADSDEFPYPYTTAKGTPLFVMGCANPECGAEFHRPLAREAIAAWNRRADSPKEKL